MWKFLKRNILSEKDFKVTILYDNSTRSGSVNYTTTAPSANEVLTRLYDYINDEPVLIIGSQKEGRSVVIPRDIVTQIEVLYLKEHDEQV